MTKGKLNTKEWTFKYNPFIQKIKYPCFMFCSFLYHMIFLKHGPTFV